MFSLAPVRKEVELILQACEQAALKAKQDGNNAAYRQISEAAKDIRNWAENELIGGKEDYLNSPSRRRYFE